MNLLKERGGQPIFYKCVGRLMRLAKEIVKAAELVTQDGALKVLVECRGTN